MPLTPVATPQFPDVPQGAGVPPLNRDPTQPLFKTLLLVADALTILRSFLGPQWGIFTATGGLVVIPDSVISVDFRREASISNYPVEQGSFASYDKVLRPYDVRVRLVCDGTATPRTLFLSQIDAAYQSLDLFIVATPDAVYSNINIVHYDVRRSNESGGASMVQVDVWLEQVRSAGPTQFTDTSTKSLSAADSANLGTVQAGPPTAAQVAVSSAGGLT